MCAFCWLLNKMFDDLHKSFTPFCVKPANGWRYPLVGGTRQRYFAGTSPKPRKVPENPPTPTSRVHAVLGALTECNIHRLTKTDFFMAHNVRCPTFESLF